MMEPTSFTRVKNSFRSALSLLAIWPRPLVNNYLCGALSFVGHGQIVFLSPPLDEKSDSSEPLFT